MLQTDINMMLKISHNRLIRSHSDGFSTGSKVHQTKFPHHQSILRNKTGNFVIQWRLPHYLRLSLLSAAKVAPLFTVSLSNLKIVPFQPYAAGNDGDVCPFPGDLLSRTREPDCELLCCSSLLLDIFLMAPRTRETITCTSKNKPRAHGAR